MTTSGRPIVTFSNTVDDIMDYLVKRTDDTIGKQVDRSQLAVVGKVRESEARSIPIRPENVAPLQPWLSGEAGVGPQIIIQITRVDVERWLFGSGEAEQLEIAYAYPAENLNGGPDFIPIFSVGDRGLLFLVEVPPNVPYAPYIPQSAYRLAPKEKWVRNFQVTDYDEQGQTFTRDETAKVEETIGAVQWYAALPREKPQALRRALLQALDDPGPRVVRHAIRDLAQRGDSNTAQVFKERFQNATEDLKVRFMLGLWILREQEAAENFLEDIFRIHGKYVWLASWGVEPTVVKKGQSVDILYGPDPFELKGD
jgi:hypothetical protein